MKLINKKCARCNIAINQTNWVRLGSGYLICIKCHYTMNSFTKWTRR